MVAIIKPDHTLNVHPHLNLADARAEPFRPEFLVRDRPTITRHSGTTQRLSFSEDVPASECDRAVDKLEAMELRCLRSRKPRTIERSFLCRCPTWDVFQVPTLRQMLTDC